MAYSGLSGQYGLMPATALRQKNEITALDENPYALDNHNRESLRDMRCEAPFLASDLAREDNHSKEFLSIRFNAHRTGDIPDRPDDFYELTGRDPRGRTTDPRMDQARAQMMSRAPQYKFGTSAEDFVQEQPKPPSVLIAQIADAFAGIKSRLKIFATSHDGMQQERMHFVAEPASRVDTSTAPIMLSSITDMQQRNDATRILERITASGWDRVTDTEFKVAAYGAVNKGLEGFTGKRADTEQDVATKPKFLDQLAHAALAKQMATVLTMQAGTDSKFATAHDQSGAHAGLKKAVTLAGANTTAEQMRVARFADLTVQARATQTANSAHRYQDLQTTKVESMHAATKPKAVHAALNTHKAIIASARLTGENVETETKSMRAHDRVDNFLAKKSARWTESLKTAPLSALIKRKQNNMLSTADQQRTRSREQSQREAAALTSESDHFVSAVVATKNTDGVLARFKGSMGKQTRQMMNTDRPVGLHS